MPAGNRAALGRLRPAPLIKSSVSSWLLLLPLVLLLLLLLLLLLTPLLLLLLSPLLLLLLQLLWLLESLSPPSPHNTLFIF